ncbi:Long chain base2 isoform 1 [Hibiscus syriacus]|uniref:Long chain base2 isoform 1 n=1 Tax=Hibiscus syriacus TaxID=106335 RepID=A0A6A3B5L5_HIBSY|nr:Long chain base2 isoform 1 [Hibiscus syriacus]
MKVLEDDDPISISKRLLVSLSDQIQNINNFKGKWALIKSKLSSLQDHSLNSPISLLKCKHAGLTEGKLKTQSDLDAVLAKLNRHISDCEILIRSGVLQDGAVSTSSSKKEAVRVESRNLITRGSRARAITGLELFRNEGKTVAAISRVSTVESSKHVLVAEGLLLNHSFESLNPEAVSQRKSMHHFTSFNVFERERYSDWFQRWISSLLEICQAGTPGSQAFAAGFEELDFFRQIKENIIEENAVFVLIGLVSSGTALAQENSIGCLCNLVSGDSNLKLLIVKEGGIECLKNFMDSSPNPKGLEWGFRVRIAAAKAAIELRFSSKARKKLGECGCIAPLIKMLDGKAVEEKEAGAMALSRLVLYAGNKKKQMVAAGACVYLQKLVEMNVEGAKKLLESLGRGKMWGVFARP